jgi:hypothetical protein
MDDFNDPHHLCVALAREKGHPIFFLKCPSGTTLDVLTSELEARNERLRRKTPCELWIQKAVLGTLVRLEGATAPLRVGAAK